MVKAVRVLSRSDIANFGPYIFTGQLAAHYGAEATYICSVHSSNETALFKNDPYCLQLCFDDIVCEVPALRLAGADDMEAIAELVRCAHADEAAVLFIAQCDGGSSRSGAIGAVAAHYCGISDEDFLAENPGINPNRYLRSGLAALLS